jgi:hypothetical protein
MRILTKTPVNIAYSQQLKVVTMTTPKKRRFFAKFSRTFVLPSSPKFNYRSIIFIETEYSNQAA